MRRDEAERELMRAGERAIPTLRQAKRSPDPETASRAARLLLRVDADEPMPDALRECVDHWLVHLRSSPGHPCHGVIEVFELAPTGTAERLVAHLEDRRPVQAHSDSRVGQWAATWLSEITERGLGGVYFHYAGREEESKRSIAAWRAWWADYRTRPLREWYWGLEYDEVKRLRRIIVTPHPSADDRAFVGALGRRAVPYLLQVVASGAYAYLEGDVWVIRWEVASRMLTALTGEEVRWTGTRYEDHQEVIRAWRARLQK